MAITTQERILKILRSYNPWWVSGAVNPGFCPTYKRFSYYEAMKRLQETQVRRTVVLTGARRVGKTTIQFQMIDALLRQ